MCVLWDSTSLFIGFERAYDAFRREVLYNIDIEFRVTVKLVWLNLV
jgi:hypothetical protein